MSPSGVPAVFHSEVIYRQAKIVKKSGPELSCFWAKILRVMAAKFLTQFELKLHSLPNVVKCGGNRSRDLRDYALKKEDRNVSCKHKHKSLNTLQCKHEIFDSKVVYYGSVRKKCSHWACSCRLQTQNYVVTQKYTPATFRHNYHS